jgi:4-carboxymuconolactone decarboxylase
MDNSSMSDKGRLAPLDETNLQGAQKEMYDVIKKVRGHVLGPWAIWLRNPALAEHALGLQSKLQTDVKLERRLLALLILVTARRASAQFVWFVHEAHALDFGVSPEIVEAIKSQRTPDFAKEDERAVYDITNELLTYNTVSDATYARGLKLFGEEVLVEIVSAVGFYVMAAMTINTFRAPVPGGGRPLA